MASDLGVLAPDGGRAPDDVLSHAMELIIDEEVEHLPVMEPDGRLVGMCTRTDILRARHRFSAEAERRS